MVNTLRQAQLIRDRGILTSPIGGNVGEADLCERRHRRNRRRCRARPRLEGGNEVPLLGHQDPSFEEMADIIADVTRRAWSFVSSTLPTC